MKVKIIKSALTTYWYADKIGKVFKVKKAKYTSDYVLKKQPTFHIDKEDCEIVKNKNIKAFNGIIVIFKNK